LLNQRAGKIIVKSPSTCDQTFLYYQLSSNDKRRTIALMAAGAASQANVSPSQVESIEVWLPVMATQRKIAAILSAYDDMIGNNTRRIQILEWLAQAFYREWFVNFHYPDHEKIKHVKSDLGNIPQGWEVTALSSLVDFAKGRKPAATRQEQLPGDVKLLLIDSLHGGEAMFTEPTKLVLAETRDTIMVMDGASSCEVTIGSSGAVGSTLGRFRTTCPDSFSSHALYRFLESKAEEFKSKNIGAAIPHANKDYILTQSVAVPPKAIASSFQSQLEPVQGMIENLKLQSLNLRRTRDLLLPKLISGALDVSKLDIETA
jgi:type I restriction enzyme, S subunit